MEISKFCKKLQYRYVGSQPFVRHLCHYQKGLKEVRSSLKFGLKFASCESVKCLEEKNENENLRTRIRELELSLEDSILHKENRQLKKEYRVLLERNDEQIKLVLKTREVKNEFKRKNEDIIEKNSKMKKENEMLRE